MFVAVREQDTEPPFEFHGIFVPRTHVPLVLRSRPSWRPVETPKGPALVWVCRVSPLTAEAVMDSAGCRTGGGGYQIRVVDVPRRLNLSCSLPPSRIRDSLERRSPGEERECEKEKDWRSHHPTSPSPSSDRASIPGPPSHCAPGPDSSASGLRPPGLHLNEWGPPAFPLRLGKISCPPLTGANGLLTAPPWLAPSHVPPLHDPQSPASSVHQPSPSPACQVLLPLLL
ncbi:hypothetical protein GGTG_07054 [Gaeumannomyces tritici R3-111a-1]|uniref:Uncharacterized protein n=1 Tax=Gaeumannomyces tritici (strain R3-111a-1) TaxID=644352 RepID=J3P0K9_GAET3|nr:hypothetical protein GGTG_07054 [Gaeumannomyces tritici R3-111a-1]EJT77142.1 hypothetical protein GGTG_07054 [Gaeumannomyces tritici R3-111a-1]